MTDRRGKSATTIRRHMKELRASCIEQQDDPVLARVAYAMESAVFWTTKKTVGWPSLAEDARIMTRLLKQDLARRP